MVLFIFQKKGGEIVDVGELIVRLGLDKSNFNKGMNDAKSDANSFSSFLKGAFQFTVGQGIFDLLKEGMKEAWDMSLGFNSAMQQNQISFETMLGSADKAGTLLSQIGNMAANTPFTLPQLADSTKKLEAFGFSAAEIPDDLKKIGDASSGLSLGADGINRITIALGQMEAKGKVTAQDMMQLTDAGVPAWDILAKAMGKSTAEVMKLSEQGLIPADTAVKQLIDGMETRFPNMMDKQSKSFEGLMSTLKDNTQMTLGEIMKPEFEDLTNNILPSLIKKTQDLKEAFQINGMKGVLNELFPPELATTINVIGSTIGNVFSFISQHGQAVLAVVGGITAAFVAYKGAVLAISVAQEAQNLVTAAGILLTGNQAAAEAMLAFSTTEAGTAIEGATAAQWLLNTAMAASPVGIFAAAVGLLVAQIAIWNTMSDDASTATESFTQKAIDSAEKVKNAQIDALDKETKARKDDINRQIDDLDKSHSAVLNNIQEEYQAQVDGLQAQEQALKDSIQKRKEALDDEHNDAIQKIRDYYGVASETSHSLTDIVKEDADKQKKALEDAYNAATKTLEDQTNAQIDAINEQIAAIDNKSKAEDEAEQNAKDNQKLRTLQMQLDNAKSVTEKAIIQTQINDLEKEMNKRKDQDVADQQKTALQKQIDQLKKAEEDKKAIMKSNLDAEKAEVDKATQAKIDKIQEERKAKESAENAKYKAAKDSLDAEDKALDGWSKKQKKVLDDNLKSKQDAENEKYKAAKKSLDDELEAVMTTEQKKRDEIEKTYQKAVQAAQAQDTWSQNLKRSISEVWNELTDPASWKALADPSSWPIIGKGIIGQALTGNSMTFQNFGGYKDGTDYASPGLHWVNEETQPFLMHFKGGETVLTKDQSEKMLNNSQPNVVQVFLDGTMIHQYYDYSQGRNVKFEARRQGL
ncbi:MAG: tape measure protein [Bacillota bacterium]|nr:tape measure protein [Bacillota bacterium]